MRCNSEKEFLALRMTLKISKSQHCLGQGCHPKTLVKALALSEDEVTNYLLS
jgi:hypothetical protein